MHASPGTAGPRRFAHALAFAGVLVCLGASAASNVVEFTYDAAGNITNLQRQPAAGFAITSFDPGSGAVGTTVTIYGAGFSATPANNEVKFNGTLATVSASQPGSISTTVPSGATTGRVTVKVGGVTATSPADFVVIVPGAPVITSFTPTSGASGTSVTVSGADFTTSGMTVKLNGVTASATLTSTTQFGFTVPGATASGRIAATTGVGTGTSAQDFLVPPPGIALADVVTTQRVSPGSGVTNISVATPSKHALLLFDGTANGYYTLQLGQVALSPTTAQVAYKVVSPDNTQLSSGIVGVTAARPTLHIPKLPTTGTYSIVLSPGTATLNANVRIDADPVVAIDGAAVASTFDTLYQSARFLVDVAGAQRIDIGAAAVTPVFGGDANVTFKTYLPDGSGQLGSTLPSCTEAELSNLAGNCEGYMTAPVAGRYVIIASNAINTAANFSLVLSSELTGTLPAVDTTQTVSWARVGQDLRYSFVAAASESLAVGLSSIAGQPQAQNFRPKLYSPSGTQVPDCTAGQATAWYCELGAATAGTYVLEVDPAFGAHGSVRMGLKQGAEISTASSATAFSPSGIGESARFRFTATAGQKVVAALTGLVHVGGPSSTTLRVFGSNRAQIGSVGCDPNLAGGSCKLTLANLAAGNYSLVITPPSGVTVSGNVKLSEELTGTLVYGTPQAISATHAGQNARYTFAGTAGDNVLVKVYGVTTTPSAQPVSVRVYRPDGAFLASANASPAAQGLMSLWSLPATGTYTVLMEPIYGITWQATASVDPGIQATVDGSTVSLATAVAGEPLRYRFSVTSGQRIELGIAALTYSPQPSGVSMLLHGPTGTQLGSQTCTTGGSCELTLASVPTTGIHTVLLTPYAVNSITAGTFAISTPLPGTFVIGDPAQTVTIQRAGQTARYTFSGISGQLLRLNWTGASVSGGWSVAAKVLKPDGSTLTSGTITNGSNSGFDVASLPTTGTYTVELDPSWGASLSASMSLVTR